MVRYSDNHNGDTQSKFRKTKSHLNSQFLSPRDISIILQVNYHKVLDLIAMGSLKAFRIGGVYRVSKSDFENYLKPVEVEVFSLPIER